MKISIVIPVFKVENYIHQCLDSIINQTYKDLEIIIIDDGSPDDCGHIADEYARTDSRIKVLHKSNEGLSAARNDGIQEASGEWISFVDSDDWLELNTYETLVASVGEHNPDILIFKGYRNFESKQSIINGFPNDFYTEDRGIIQKIQRASLCMYYAPYAPSIQGFPWNKMIRTSLIKDNDLKFARNVKANEDVIFNLHLFQHAKSVQYINKAFYHYRDNPNGITVKYTPDRLAIDLEIYKEMKKIGEDYGLDKEYYDALNARIVMNSWQLAERCYMNKDNPKPFSTRMREMAEALKIEPIYSAFENVDRRKLPDSCKFITLRRHNNVPLIWGGYYLKKVIKKIQP